VAKHLIDTDVYVDLIRTAKNLPLIRELYEKEAPGIYFSSVVAQELLAGVRSAAGKRHVEALVGPFERMRRIITPGHRESSHQQ
jgi:predicted nucleic acid-binding protein